MPIANKLACMRYGERLKRARGDMTQAHLAEVSGVSQSLISQLERSETATGFLIALLAGAVGAAIPRSAAERAAFQRAYPCPSTGLPKGPCPGYVVDHIHPLCAGGADRRRNMQWQPIDVARRKDTTERAHCRTLLRKYQPAY